ncbi:MAG: tyrosine-type recombinase/integrase [Candidatus Ornithomonoglobus sp.]
MKGSLQTKGGKFYAVFRVNGKQKWFNLHIEDKKGNKRKAEKALAELIHQYNENPHMFAKTDFCEYIQKWLNNVKTHVDIVTYEGYDITTRNHILPYFKEKKLALQDVNISDLEAFYNLKAVSGRLDGKDGGMSYRSIKMFATILSLVFKYAQREGLVRDNPAEKAQLPKLEKKVAKISFYNVEECNDLLKASAGTPLHDIIAITILYGLRRSEVMGLCWDAIDFENNTLEIKHTRVLNKTVVAKDKTKTDSSHRVYPLLPEIREILLRIKYEQTDNARVFGKNYNDSGYIFVNELGEPFYPSYPTTMLTKLFKHNPELRKIRFHDLRHSCASVLLEKGWSMKAISDWLGHSEIGITMNLYTHIDLDSKRERAKTLGGMLEL